MPNEKRTAKAALQPAACPCGGGAYAACCGPFHGGVPAPTAEQLMRARYSAYVLQDHAFLAATWHPTTRPAMLPPDEGTRWLGLEVRRHEQDGDRATVEFVARYRIDGRGQRLHETSRFVREVGWWWYVDGSHDGEVGNRSNDGTKGTKGTKGEGGMGEGASKGKNGKDSGSKSGNGNNGNSPENERS